MRNQFGKWINEAAKKDKKIILLVGDIGFGVFDEFRKNHPLKFINCGIAEQNMIGVAAGLAAKGFKPYVYTIIPFLIFRPFEFLRNLVFHQNLPVKLVGVGGGFAYDKLGFTHYAKEDINLINNLPNSRIFTPYSPSNSIKCFNKTLSLQNPCYVRLMKGGDEEIKPVHKYNNYDLLTNYGNDFCIFTQSILSKTAIEACVNLKKKFSLNGSVIAIYENKFNKILLTKMNKYKNVIFFEESIFPGIYNEYSISLNTNTNHDYLYISRDIETKVGTRKDILNSQKMGEQQLIKKILKLVK